MLGGLLCPLVGGRPIYMIDGWDPPTVLDAMVEEQISAGSGSTYFFTSLLDCPGYGPEHVELMRYIGLGGSPIPNAVAERADELGISLVRSYGCTEHPSVTGSQHTDPKEKRIHTDGCPLEWVEVRTVDEEGHDVGVGSAGRDPHPRARPLRRLHRPRADRRGDRRRTGGSAPATSACSTPRAI